MVAFFNERAFRARPGFISTKPQISYLHQYCESLGVRTLLFEAEYVDRHFSEDFGGYYVRCFENYHKKCSRLHFFTKIFTGEKIEELLNAKAPSETDQISNELGYSGFVVIKPLPETVVGRTCLQPFPPAAKFPTVGQQRVNLFGIDLGVKSIPFQEQDHEVAACATSALWTVLEGTARLFQHQIMSPLEITRSAQVKMPMFGRSFPNDGLNMYQMADAVRHLGLELDIIEVRQSFLLQAAAYAYLRGSIPVLLGIDFNLNFKKSSELHAVALTGYNVTARKPRPITAANFHLLATRVGRFYAHDDGVGPFSPIELNSTSHRLQTSWIASGKRVQAYPDQFWFPCTVKFEVHSSTFSKG